MTAWLVVLAALAGCAVSAPVQEMSNARQAIQAARDAQAGDYAPERLEQAERLLATARSELEAGNYRKAREDALAAKEMAVEARSLAIDANNMRP